MSQDQDLIVVGAGAAGLWAATEAARRGSRVLLVEKTARAGTKVLASGGSHCNLTTTLEARPAAALFSSPAARFLRGPFQALPPREVRRRFEAWGVPTEEAPMEKVFPTSGRARDVRDALLAAAVGEGVQVRYRTPVMGVRPLEDGGGWSVALGGAAEGFEILRTPRVILAVGGKSVPRSGTTGDGYTWLTDLGLPLVHPRPALTPLHCSATWVHELAGVTLPDCELRLLAADGSLLGRRRRPVLFTHKGLSGPGPMDLSGLVSLQGDAPRVKLLLDLTPDLSREDLRDEFLALAAPRGRAPASKMLRGKIPRRLLPPLFAAAGITPLDKPAGDLSRAQRHGLIEAIKGLEIPVDGTLGFEPAEVTAGGLDLGQVNPRTMEVRGHPGLFVCGELLDVDGPIGGLNFQAAFATGELAGAAASQKA